MGESVKGMPCVLCPWSTCISDRAGPRLSCSKCAFILPSGKDTFLLPTGFTDPLPEGVKTLHSEWFQLILEIRIHFVLFQISLVGPWSFGFWSFTSCVSHLSWLSNHFHSLLRACELSSALLWVPETCVGSLTPGSENSVHTSRWLWDNGNGWSSCVCNSWGFCLSSVGLLWTFN